MAKWYISHTSWGKGNHVNLNSHSALSSFYHFCVMAGGDLPCLKCQAGLFLVLQTFLQHKTRTDSFQGISCILYLALHNLNSAPTGIFSALTSSSHTDSIFGSWVLNMFEKQLQGWHFWTSLMPSWSILYHKLQKERKLRIEVKWHGWQIKLLPAINTKLESVPWWQTTARSKPQPVRSSL